MADPIEKMIEDILALSRQNMKPDSHNEGWYFKIFRPDFGTGFNTARDATVSVLTERFDLRQEYEFKVYNRSVARRKRPASEKSIDKPSKKSVILHIAGIILSGLEGSKTLDDFLNLNINAEQRRSIKESAGFLIIEGPAVAQEFLNKLAEMDFRKDDIGALIKRTLRGLNENTEVESKILDLALQACIKQERYELAARLRDVKSEQEKQQGPER